MLVGFLTFSALQSQLFPWDLASPIYFQGQQACPLINGWNSSSGQE
jgi:hypothetical protein